MKEWISIEDKKPEEAKRVLCVTESGQMQVGYIYLKQWYYDAMGETFERWGYKVTHWQLLPEPLKVKQ